MIMIVKSISTDHKYDPPSMEGRSVVIG